MKSNRIKKRFRYNPKRYFLFLFLFAILFSMSVGYAFLTQTLEIDGTSQFVGATWDVHFANVQISSGSVTPTTAATITNPTTVTFDASLEEVGDYYEFTVDVVNGGTLGAMIDSFHILPELTAAQQNYLSYTVTYSDGIELASYQKLDSGNTETLKVRFEYLENADASLYPTEDDNLTIAFDVTYVQADENAVDRPALPFEDSDWDTIINTIKKKNSCGPYNVGDSKEIDMGTFGTHTLRIANCSTPTECSIYGFSQTGCGVVLEFTDIIINRRINPYVEDDTTTLGVNSKGGWKYSDMRAFLNSTTYAYENINYSTTGIYSSLPAVIKNAIIDTKVISGHNIKDSTNFTTTDKVYLLSTREVWERAGYDHTIDYFDTTYPYTRQLDYYKGLNVTTSNYSNAIKKNGTSADWWWLRSPGSAGSEGFLLVNNNGNWNIVFSAELCGVSPAFRIA